MATDSGSGYPAASRRSAAALLGRGAAAVCKSPSGLDGQWLDRLRPLPQHGAPRPLLIKRSLGTPAPSSQWPGAATSVVGTPTTLRTASELPRCTRPSPAITRSSHMSRREGFCDLDAGRPQAKLAPALALLHQSPALEQGLGRDWTALGRESWKAEVLAAHGCEHVRESLDVSRVVTRRSFLLQS